VNASFPERVFPLAAGELLFVEARRVGGWSSTMLFFRPAALLLDEELAFLGADLCFRAPFCPLAPSSSACRITHQSHDSPHCGSQELIWFQQHQLLRSAREPAGHWSREALGDQMWRGCTASPGISRMPISKKRSRSFLRASETEKREFA
jgi:hypothetical protein